jgi:hypothetical protein
VTLWTAIVLVALIFGIAAVLIERQRRPGRSGSALEDADRRALEEEHRRAQEEIAALRERLETLERIATDPARRTAEEIEALRNNRER